MRKATDYMVGKYRSRWAGSRVYSGQALDWPRVNVPIIDAPYRSYFDSDSVPLEVKHACAILALKANSASLIEDQSQKVISVQVGPITTTYEPSSSTVVKYSEIDNMLSPYLKAGANRFTMVRI